MWIGVNLVEYFQIWSKVGWVKFRPNPTSLNSIEYGQIWSSSSQFLVQPNQKLNWKFVFDFLDYLYLNI